MRLTYRKTILLTLGRQETKLYRSSDAYRAEVCSDARDMANDRDMPVEIYLSSWGCEDKQNPHAFTALPGHETWIAAVPA